MSVDVATNTLGGFALGPDGDFDLASGDAAVRAELLRAFLTTPGEIPYHPSTGAGAAAKEGGPQSGGDELARAARVEAQRHPDVLEAGAGQVSRSTASGGLTTVSVAVRTRWSPQTQAAVSTRIPG